MKKIYVLSIATAFALISCKDNKAEVTTADSPTAVEAGHTDHDGHDHGTTTEAATATPIATGDAPKDGLNPPHGQPGHRCDIAVGAPLNSAPAQPQNAQPTQAAQPANNGQGFLGQGNAQAAAPQATQAAPQQAAKPAQVTAPGMQGKPNPAHGQPGHRCDIAVGQPLP